MIYTFFFVDANPTSNNAEVSCMAAFDWDTARYSVNLTVTLDDTFTPAVISAIQNLQVVIFEIDTQGNAIPGTVVSDLQLLDSSVEEGPVTLMFHYNDLSPLLGGHGYQLHVSKLIWLSVNRT